MHGIFAGSEDPTYQELIVRAIFC